MYEGQSVGVVVPAYNESGSVGTVLEAVPDFVDRIFVVDDASTDDTWSVVRALAGDATVTDRDGDAETTLADGGALVRRPGDRPDHDGTANGRGDRSDVGRESHDGDDRIVPIRHEENRGAGGALKTGYREALAADVDLVVTLDADGQMDPAMMDRLLDPLVARKRAFAKGDRLASAEHRAAMPRLRLVGNWLLTYLTRIASGYWGLRDPQNGYTAITGDALAAIDLDALPDHHDYCNALFAQLRVADVDVIDVPMAAIYGDEESTIDFASFVTRTSATLARWYWWRCRRQYLTTTAGPLGRARSAVGDAVDRLRSAVGAGRATGSTDSAGGSTREGEGE